MPRQTGVSELEDDTCNLKYMSLNFQIHLGFKTCMEKKTRYLRAQGWS